MTASKQREHSNTLNSAILSTNVVVTCVLSATGQYAFHKLYVDTDEGN